MTTDVLLTRPDGDNTSLERRLESEGLSCTAIPLLDIAPHDSHDQRATVMDLDRVEHVIFVSRNAVRHGIPVLEQYWPQWPGHLRWYAVGESTAQSLRSFGIDPVVPARADSEGLLALEALDDVREQRILVVRGVGGRATLAGELEARGATVTYLEVYERRARELHVDEREILARALPAVVVVYSGSALEALGRHVSSTDRAGCTLVVPSARLQAEANHAGFEHVVDAGSAAEEAMARAVLGVRSK